MNEFIKKASRHISNSRSDISVAIKEGLKMLYNDLKKEESYIGKTDINGNKIYADCSIVEFQYYNGEDVEHLAGYFYYSDDYMQYEIDIIKGDENSGQFNFLDLIGIKVIGTLQENSDIIK